jgi:hypothetical protein
MQKKLFEIIMFLTPTVLFIVYLFNTQSIINKQNGEIIQAKTDSINLQTKINKPILGYENSVRSSIVKVNNITVENIYGKKLLLQDLIDDKKLIFKFNQNSCMSCVEHIVEVLKQLGDQVGMDKIIMISNFSKIRYLEAFQKQKEIKFKCYNSMKNIGISLDNDSIFQHVEFTLILNKDMRAILPRMSTSNDSLNSIYYSRIAEILTEPDYK